MTSEKAKEPWHQHPIAVSLFTIVVGSLVIGPCLDHNSRKAANHSALVEKRLSVVQDIGKFISQSHAIFRLYEQLNNLQFATKRKGIDFQSKEDDIQNLINSNDALIQSIRLELSLYFTTRAPIAKFEQVEAKYGHALDIANKNARKSPLQIFKPELDSTINDLAVIATEVITLMGPDVPLPKHFSDVSRST